MGHVMFAEGLITNIQKLYQDQTYYGLIEGIPTAKINQRFIEQEPARAKRRFGEVPVHLIEPVQAPVLGSYHGEEEVRLPKYVCAALLHHPDAVHNDSVYSDLYWSAAVLIWYQDQLAMPLDAQVLLQLTQISWRDIARDFSI